MIQGATPALASNLRRPAMAAGDSTVGDRHRRMRNRRPRPDRPEFTPSSKTVGEDVRPRCPRRLSPDEAIRARPVVEGHLVVGHDLLVEVEVHHDRTINLSRELVCRPGDTRTRFTRGRRHRTDGRLSAAAELPHRTDRGAREGARHRRRPCGQAELMTPELARQRLCVHHGAETGSSALRSI